MARYLYSELASLVQARKNCETSNNTEWFEKHSDRIESLVSDYMPSGSGFDSGTKIDLDVSHSDSLVFNTAYHHMDESGGYGGWTEHQVIVKPSLSGAFNLRITGRNRNDIKEYMYDTFDYALRTNIEQFPDPFANVLDSTICQGCRGSASTTGKDGKPYCDGCRKSADARVLDVGSLIKMKLWEDYTSRGLSPWQWLRVLAIHGVDGKTVSVDVRCAPHPMDATYDDQSEINLPVSVINTFHTTIL